MDENTSFIAKGLAYFVYWIIAYVHPFIMEHIGYNNFFGGLSLLCIFIYIWFWSRMFRAWLGITRHWINYK